MISVLPGVEVFFIERAAGKVSAPVVIVRGECGDDHDNELRAIFVTGK